MKRQIFSLLLLTVVQIAMAQTGGNEAKYEKKKSFSKSYSVTSKDKLNLSNQFGSMNLVTWDKNEIQVDVAITAKSNDENRAQEIMDRISIEENKTGEGVSVKTKFSDKQEIWNGKKNHQEESMRIDYTVHVPASNPLQAENQFGDMTIGDYKGEATLTSKFGSLTTGHISNAKNISVEFGKANIGRIDGGKVSVKFSKGSIAKLSGNVDANFEFCDKIKVNVDNDIKDLSIRNSYSTLYLDLNKNLSATYDIKTSFGDVTNKSSFTINNEGDEDSYTSKHRYKGTSGSGAAKMKVSSDFGKVILGHDLQVDMTETKKKDKGVRS